MAGTLVTLGGGLPGGRPRKPDAVKALSGNARKDRTNPDAPKGDAIQIPPPPKHFTARERESWKRYAAIVGPMQIVTAADLRAFERLVEVDAVIAEAQARMRDDLDPEGRVRLIETTTTRNGEWSRPRPELELIARFEKILLFHFSRFGLTPADRSRVSALKTAESDPLDEFAPGAKKGTAS